MKEKLLKEIIIKYRDNGDKYKKIDLHFELEHNKLE